MKKSSVANTIAKRTEDIMITILIRTVIIYLILNVAIRLMGKRQIGELEISDFVTTLLISEIASLPITDNSIPISHAFIPIITLIFLETSSSLLIVSVPRLKNLLTARPTTLIRNGKLCQQAMRQARISLDELISELRQKDITDLDEVSYAILEQSGKISVITKARHRQPTVEQLGLSAKENGIYHIVIDNGVINRHSLCQMNKGEEEIERILKKKKLTKANVYLMMMSDAGEVTIIQKEES